MRSSNILDRLGKCYATLGLLKRKSDGTHEEMTVKKPCQDMLNSLKEIPPIKLEENEKIILEVASDNDDGNPGPRTVNYHSKDIDSLPEAIEEIESWVKYWRG